MQRQMEVWGKYGIDHEEIWKSMGKVWNKYGRVWKKYGKYGISMEEYGKVWKSMEEVWKSMESRPARFSNVHCRCLLSPSRSVRRTTLPHSDAQDPIPAAPARRALALELEDPNIRIP
eukprot:gene2836-biopygen8649